MVVKIYGAPLSAPFRTCLMTAEAVGVAYENVPVDILGGETRTPEYLKVRDEKYHPNLLYRY